MDPDQVRENPGEYPVMSSVDGDWQFQLLSQAFLITSQQDPGQHIELSVSAAYDMLDYLYKLRDDLAQLTGQAREGNI